MRERKYKFTYSLTQVGFTTEHEREVSAATEALARFQITRDLPANIKVFFIKTEIEPLFYIQCISNYAYDYILWWKPDSKGYTHDLNKAGLYTAEEAQSICAMRGEEVAWPEDVIKKHIEASVSIEVLRQNELRPSFGKEQYLRRVGQEDCNDDYF
jgi:hypothetical protein